MIKRKLAKVKTLVKQESKHFFHFRMLQKISPRIEMFGSKLHFLNSKSSYSYNVSYNVCSPIVVFIYPMSLCFLALLS